MKKILSLLILAMAFAVTSHAADHETLLGVPLNGTLSQFASKMSAKGVRTVERESTVYTLDGPCSIAYKLSVGLICERDVFGRRKVKHLGRRHRHGELVERGDDSLSRCHLNLCRIVKRREVGRF